MEDWTRRVPGEKDERPNKGEGSYYADVPPLRPRPESRGMDELNLQIEDMI